MMKKKLFASMTALSCMLSSLSGLMTAAESTVPVTEYVVVGVSDDGNIVIQDA